MAKLVISQEDYIGEISKTNIPLECVDSWRRDVVVEFRNKPRRSIRENMFVTDEGIILWVGGVKVTITLEK